jgi:hypothetical protein
MPLEVNPDFGADQPVLSWNGSNQAAVQPIQHNVWKYVAAFLPGFSNSADGWVNLTCRV